MLEKVGIQIFVKSIFKLNTGLLPVHLVSERYFRVEGQFDFIFRSQIDVNNLLPVEADVKLLVRPDVVAWTSFLILHFPYNSYRT